MKTNMYLDMVWFVRMHNGLNQWVVTDLTTGIREGFISILPTAIHE